MSLVWLLGEQELQINGLAVAESNSYGWLDRIRPRFHGLGQVNSNYSGDVKMRYVTPVLK